MPNLLGTAPNQVPTNADLGKLAFMDVVDTVTNNPYLDTAISDTKPSLLLDFANSKTLDPRITYTRASTASYYDGKTTAVAEQNLITQSQTFASPWTAYLMTIATNSTTAPDGTNTSATYTSTNSSATQQGLVYGIGSLGISTFSVYAKAGTSNFVGIHSNGSVVGYANFNVSTGTVASSGGCTASIVSVGNGWYRCVMANVNVNTISNFIISAKDADPGAGVWGNGTMASGNYVYLWGAQLEQRSSVSSYTPTTTSTITNYIPALQTAAASVPRFDHDPVTGESKGFLIEEQRTNLLTYSSAFDNAAWNKDGTTISADTVIAPDGTLTGDKVVESATTANHRVFYVATIAAVANTYTVFAKSSERKRIMLREDTSTGAYATFDLSTGSIVSNGSGGVGTIASVGNGWYRCSMTWTATSGNLNMGIWLIPDTGTSNSNGSYTGNGYSGIYLWGAQLEAGSFATSYIPTTSAQVTRSADAASITGANFSNAWNRAAEAIEVEGRVISTTNSGCAFANIRGSGSPEGRVELRVSGSTPSVLVTNSSGTLTLNTGSGTVSANTLIKMSLALQTNDVAFYTNGTQTVTGSNLNSTPPADYLSIGSYNGSSNVLNGWLSRLAYYPKRLSDAELQEMTL